MRYNVDIASTDALTALTVGGVGALDARPKPSSVRAVEWEGELRSALYALTYRARDVDYWCERAKDVPFDNDDLAIALSAATTVAGFRPDRTSATAQRKWLRSVATTAAALAGLRDDVHAETDLDPEASLAAVRMAVLATVPDPDDDDWEDEVFTVAVLAPKMVDRLRSSLAKPRQRPPAKSPRTQKIREIEKNMTNQIQIDDTVAINFITAAALAAGPRPANKDKAYQWEQRVQSNALTMTRVTAEFRSNYEGANKPLMAVITDVEFEERSQRGIVSFHPAKDPDTIEKVRTDRTDNPGGAQMYDLVEDLIGSTVLMTIEVERTGRTKKIGGKDTEITVRVLRDVVAAEMQKPKATSDEDEGEDA